MLRASGWTLATCMLLLLVVGQPADARPDYAAKEQVDCLHCHVAPGQARNFRGLYYAANGKSFAQFDELYEAKVAGVQPGSKGPAGTPKVAGYPAVKRPPVFSFTMKDIDGKPVNLGRFAGNVVLIVNVASNCGNTPQYAKLQELFEKYRSRGFTVLGFPANNFGMQEPGTNSEIKEFCTSNYKVTFPMFSKISVKGDDAAPLYKWLTSKETNPTFGGDVEWNFAKFLINRKGEVVMRVPARTDPADPKVVAQIEAELAKGP